MNLLGLDVRWVGRRTEKALPLLSPPETRSSYPSWWPIVREPYAGAWQENVEIRLENVLTYAAVYACVTLIASDIGKLRIKLVLQDSNGIWNETDNVAYAPVLRKPNRFQTRIKFLEQWVTSKLVHGNTYVLKERDQRGVVVALYVLDPQRVKPLVAPDGAIYYELQRDYLSTVTAEQIIVPEREIIHDVMVPLYHPLVGVSPLTACGLAATQGLKIQEQSALFFANKSNPGGVLTAPGVISQETADRIKVKWTTEFTGANAGAVAVLGDGLHYEAMHVSAVDAQLIDQLKWSAENVCTAFRVPPYMIGIGPAPSYANVEALSTQYYTQCLQNPIESIELLLDEGLELKHGFGTELELDDLLRLDTATRVKAAADAVGSGTVSPNEARMRYHGLGPVIGGETPYLQQQNYSLAALAKRDAQADPFAPERQPEEPDEVEDQDEDEPPEDDDREEDEEQEEDELIRRFQLKAATLGLVS